MFRLHPALRLLFFAIGAVVLQGIVVSAFVAARQTAGRLVPGTNANISAAEMLVLTLFTYPAVIGWLWFCRRSLDKLSLRSMGLHAARGGRLFFSGALGGALAIGFLWAVLWLLGEIRVEGLSDLAFGAPAIRTIATLGLWALAFVAVGFVEETLFRGYGLHNATAWLGARVGLWLQALLFAAVHIGNVGNVRAMGWGFLNIVLVGVFFALTYRKTGSLWFPIGFHAGWNWFLACVFSLPVSGLSGLPSLLNVTANRNALTGGTFGAEASILLVPILAVLCLVASRAPDHPQTVLDLSLTRDGLGEVAPNVFAQNVTPQNVTPQVAPFAEPQPDEPRENRFRTRFGKDVPLDAQPLQIELPPRVPPPPPPLLPDTITPEPAPIAASPPTVVVPEITPVAPVAVVAPSVTVTTEVEPPRVKPPVAEAPLVVVREAGAATEEQPPAPVAPPKPKPPAPRW